MGIRAKAAGLAVAATMLCAAAPAVAADDISYEAHAVNPVETIDAATARVDLECHAAAPLAASTGLTQCYLHSLDDGAIYPLEVLTFPGWAVADAGTLVVPNDRYEACVAAVARYPDSLQVEKPVRCFR